MSIINKSEIPMGFGMALAQDLDAMKYFASLPRHKQAEIISKTSAIQSKEEMHDFVSKLRAE